MRSIHFDYVPEFDMSTARYDQFNEFYNGYRRQRKVEPGARTALSADGTIMPIHNSYYSSSAPVLHFASGGLYLTREISREPECRGRYTFAGFDFSIISTSNDPYGAHAIKFMSYMDESDKPRPKLIPASFNTLLYESTKGQDLLIDHVADRVWAIGAPWDTAKVTKDGVNTGEAAAMIPEKLNAYSVDAYANGPGNGFKVQRSIRLSMPRTGNLLPPNYKKNLNACVAWYAHVGAKIDEFAKQEAESRNLKRYSLSTMIAEIVDPDKVSELGFAGLSPYQRACVAVNNTSKSVPRIVQHWFQLRFDSKAFFESFATLVAK